MIEKNLREGKIKMILMLALFIISCFLEYELWKEVEKGNDIALPWALTFGLFSVGLSGFGTICYLIELF